MDNIKLVSFGIILTMLGPLAGPAYSQGWQQLWSGLPSFWGISAVDTSVCWVAGDRTLIARTTDGGSSWFWSGNGLAPDGYSAVCARSASVAWVGSFGGRIYGTVDSGKTWNLQYSYPGPGTTFIDGIYFWDDHTGIAFGDPPAYPGTGPFFVARTTNGGAVWTQVTTGVPVVTNQYGSAMNFEAAGNHFWFGSGNSSADTTVQRIVGHSSDRGVSWETLNAPPAFGNVSKVAFSDSLNGIITGHRTHIARTTNGGRNWQMRYNGVGNAVEFLKGSGTVWASGGGHLFRSNDYGTSWADQGLEATLVIGFSVVDANDVWACGADYLVLRTHTGGGVTSVVESGNQTSSPSSFSLEQNYPNPFNPTTIIKYRLERSERLRLAIYDNLGREVRVLLDGVQAAGWHLVNWDGRDRWGATVSSGVYFYKIAGDSYSETKKMVMVK